VVYSYVDEANNVEVIRSTPTPLILQSNAIATSLGGDGSTTEFVTTDVGIANSFIAEDVGSSLNLDQLADLAAQVAALQGRLGQLLEIADDVSTDDSESVKGFSETLANALQTEGSLTKTLNMQSLDFSDVAESDAELAFTASQDDDEITSLVVDLGTSARELVVDGVEFLSVKGTATVRGGEGSNNFLGDGASQNVMLGADDDVLNAGGGDDIVGSAGGNDTISGGSGNDVAFGGTGNDSVSGGTGDDKVTDSWGTDALHGDDGNDVIRAFEGGDIINGGAGADTIYGSRGDDVISGGDDNDVIYGDTFVFASRGADELSGGNGNDVMQGGFGADTFIFEFGETGENRIQRIDTGTADFEVGIDTLQFAEFGDALTVDNILAQWQDTAEGALLTSGELSILLTGITTRDLSVDDFEFV
jgi:Ca2+-binding RTX toxin-like protein